LGGALFVQPLWALGPIIAQALGKSCAAHLAICDLNELLAGGRAGVKPIHESFYGLTLADEKKRAGAWSMQAAPYLDDWKRKNRVLVVVGRAKDSAVRQQRQIYQSAASGMSERQSGGPAEIRAFHHSLTWPWLDR
jgi:hypothetical protein